jgi:hypothetical protein
VCIRVSSFGSARGWEAILLEGNSASHPLWLTRSHSLRPTLPRRSYIQDVKDVLMEKEGMVPGHTYQGDLKERFKELMRKNPEFRTLTGPQLLDTLVRLSPDENPFRGAQWGVYDHVGCFYFRMTLRTRDAAKHEIALHAHHNSRKPLPTHRLPNPSHHDPTRLRAHALTRPRAL